MTCEVLCIGSEVLKGDVVNTNAAYISAKLSEIGFDVMYHTVCDDNAQILQECVTRALERCDVVITTGGLGPTYDDITLEICAKALCKNVVFDANVLDSIQGYFSRMGRVMTDNNKKQANVIEGAKVFANSRGTAPGMCAQSDGKTIILLPGPPREMSVMLDEQAIPYLCTLTDESICAVNINTFGMGESMLEDTLGDIMKKSTNPIVAPYVDAGEVRVKVTAKAKNEDDAQNLAYNTVNQIRDILGDVVYGIDEKSIQSVLVKFLSEKGKTISTAESCTGGLLSKMITDVSGSSEVFGFGVCTYANEAKMKMLSVNQETLKEYGAVSEQTAMQMAQGIRNLSGSDIALSLTGIAGPGGGTDEKPVGLVYLGVSTKEKTYAKKLLLSRHKSTDRDYIRTLAAKNAIMEAIKILRSNYNDSGIKTDY